MAVLAVTYDTSTGGFRTQKIGSGQISDGAIISGKVASGQIGIPHIYPGAVTSAKLGPLAVGTPHLAALAIVSGKVASGGLSPLTSGKIWAGFTGNFPREEDKPAAGATLTVAETEVFNGNTPAAAAWTDLDLSGTVGANAALVLLKFWINVDLKSIAFRKNGDTDEFYTTDLVPGGCALGRSNAGLFMVFIVCTDATGKIEWKCEDLNEPVTIDVMAYIK